MVGYAMAGFTVAYPTHYFIPSSHVAPSRFFAALWAAALRSYASETIVSPSRFWRPTSPTSALSAWVATQDRQTLIAGQQAKRARASGVVICPRLPKNNRRSWPGSLRNESLMFGPPRVQENRVHPRGRQPEIIDKLSPFCSRERSLQMGTQFGRDVTTAEFPKRLNQKAAQSAGRFHVARSRTPQLDRRAADDDVRLGPSVVASAFTPRRRSRPHRIPVEPDLEREGIRAKTGGFLGRFAKVLPHQGTHVAGRSEVFK